MDRALINRKGAYPSGYAFASRRITSRVAPTAFRRGRAAP